MKIAFALFVLVAPFLSGDRSSQESADFIFTAVKTGEENTSPVLLRVRTVYKGQINEQIELYLPDTVEMKPSTEYLFKLERDLSTRIIEITSIVPLFEATAEVQKLFYTIHCIGERDKSIAGCQRSLASVCGCDGKTYGNPCEARRVGVNIYTHGRCQ